jgi:hypothetical protein
MNRVGLCSRSITTTNAAAGAVTSMHDRVHTVMSAGPPPPHAATPAPQPYCNHRCSAEPFPASLFLSLNLRLPAPKLPHSQQQQIPLRDDSAARHAVRASNAHAVRSHLRNILRKGWLVAAQRKVEFVRVVFRPPVTQSTVNTSTWNPRALYLFSTMPPLNILKPSSRNSLHNLAAHTGLNFKSHF